MKRTTLISAAAAVCALGAVVAVAAAAGADRPTLPIELRFTPPGGCEIRFAGRAFSLPQDAEPMLAALREVREGRRSARITAYGEAPYRCVGFAVFLAQRAGFKNTTFKTRRPEQAPEQAPQPR